jgi:hypothetical protein
MPRWYVLIHHIPPKPLYLRAKVRQRLARVGAVALKNSVYVLPQSADALEDLQWIAQEVIAGGGDAHIFDAGFVLPADDSQVAAQFNEARDTDYAALIADARAAVKGGRGALPLDELPAVHEKLARRFDEILRIDFFEAPNRAAATDAIAAVEQRMHSERKEDAAMLKRQPELRGKTWVTRPNVGIDRMASAWFIRRYIDPKARFRFADPSTAAASSEIRFDMLGGDFTHEEDRCTFETLVRRVGLPDRGVKALAEIVHDLDLKDDKFGRAEAFGVQKLIEGLMARHDDDDLRLERAFAMFDDLHQSLIPRKRS